MAQFRTARQEATLGHEFAEHSDFARHLMAGVAHHAGRVAFPLHFLHRIGMLVSAGALVRPALWASAFGVGMWCGCVLSPCCP
jgi:hypothetical protein